MIKFTASFLALWPRIHKRFHEQRRFFLYRNIWNGLPIMPPTLPRWSCSSSRGVISATWTTTADHIRGQLIGSRTQPGLGIDFLVVVDVESGLTDCAGLAPNAVLSMLEKGSPYNAIAHPDPPSATSFSVIYQGGKASVR